VEWGVKITPMPVHAAYSTCVYAVYQLDR